MTKISINQKECLGCSYCGECAPAIFKVDEGDFKCKLQKEDRLMETASFDLPPEQLEKVKEATEGCPIKAIELS